MLPWKSVRVLYLGATEYKRGSEQDQGSNVEVAWSYSAISSIVRSLCDWMANSGQDQRHATKPKSCLGECAPGLDEIVSWF